MDYKEALNRERAEIDKIDKELLSLFERRMSYSRKIADIKGKNNLSIWDEKRENTVVYRAIDSASSNLKGETALLMRTILTLSKGEQRKALFNREIELFPPSRGRISLDREKLICAYQGVAGAWSELAATRFFPGAKYVAKDFFEDVFNDVKSGAAHYGIVPIENSKTGAIGETYDLLRKHGCYIVGKLQVDIKQCLLAKHDTKFDDIREIASHPEGFKQCRTFLNHRAWELISSRNTAVAAEIVSKSDGNRIAAIGSRRAAELYGLNVLVPDIMDDDKNRTSFVVIAAEPEYTERDNIISATFSTTHRAGALCETLLPFMAQGINMMRIESRPSGGGKYRFFIELAANVSDPEVQAALRQATLASEYFEIIGCYSQTE